jgi:hypothetical protein
MARLLNRCQRAHPPDRHNTLQRKPGLERKPAPTLRRNPQRIPFNSLTASLPLASAVRNRHSSIKRIARAQLRGLTSAADHRDERVDGAGDMRLILKRNGIIE